MEAEIIDRRIIYDHWLTLSEVTLRLPNGAIERRHLEDHGRAAAVLLYDPDRRVALLIKQPRAPVMEAGAEPLLEVVAGRMENKSAEDTARSEAVEEAGVAISELERVGAIWSMPAISTERLELFLATYSSADRVSPGGGADHENECITVHEIGLGELWRLAAGDRLQDAKTLILVQALKIRHPELFGG